MPKKKGTEELAALKESFMAGGGARGASRKVLNKVWQMILSFQKGYSFCKAHSASYALVSYRLAYLKRFYPVEFFVSVINNGGGYYSRQTYLNEVKRMGSMVLAPDVNRSKYLFSIEGRDLRVGFSQLCGLSTPFIKRLIVERQSAPFKDLGNLITRLNPGLPEMRLLIRSGTLDSLSGGLTRPQMFWFFFTFSRHETLFLLPPVPEFIGDYSDRVKIMDERSTLGLLISCHPVGLFKKKILEILHREGIKQLITSRELPLYKDKHVYLVGLVVTGKEVITKQDKRMIFVSFEDSYSIYETVFFPESYKRFYPLLHNTGVYIIYGQVKDDMGAININVERIITMNGGGFMI